MGVVLLSNATAAEDHLIFSESASLVCEYVMDLTKVLIDVKGTTLEGPIKEGLNAKSGTNFMYTQIY